MKSISSLLFLVFLFSAMMVCTIAATATASALGPPPPLLGGYKPIKDVKDPEIQSIGKYAVEEYKKQQSIKSTFEFEDVVSGESAVVAGIKYRLVIILRSGVLLLKYQAIVWEKPWEQFKKLESFKLYPHAPDQIKH